MIHLLIASLVWAFSFGLIKHRLVGVGLDPFFVALVRLVLSFLLFLPFLRVRRDGLGRAGRLVLLGAVQYGLMYVTYLSSYRYLAAHEVALFTIFTPLFVTLLDGGARRRLHGLSLLTALLAIAGTAVIVYARPDAAGLLAGFALVQVSNLCFAFGQVGYRAVMGLDEGAEHPRKDLEVFALLYLGAILVALVPAVFSTAWTSIRLSPGQTVTLLYLGLLPSGLCFFLWNRGARRTAAGPLAVMNNAKVPLAVLCSLLFFGESASLPRLLTGGAVLLAAVVIGGRLEPADRQLRETTGKR